ncbi:hypothetical protein G6F37_001559 [Rhizopus arrhizus]|nr:hypothetical protein G6F38_000353 [Rhizopus arrhizus]KAG1163074.1 hypothetical protein G6F37_001559 [Rhizopus arrhizus]
MKHLSGSLKHRASSASLHIIADSQKQQQQLKRMTTTNQFIVPESIIKTDYNNNNSNNSSEYQKRSSTLQVNSHRKSLESKIPSRLKQSKSNQSIRSEYTATSSGSNSEQSSKSPKNIRLRQPSPARLRLSKSASSASLSNKKSSSKLTDNPKIDELPPKMDEPTNTCSCSKTNDDLLTAIRSLEEELEKEKAFSRSLQGQKEAIAKDLDYFYILSDEVTEERDRIKADYEQEKLENEQLRKTIEELQSGNDQDNSNELKKKLKSIKQQAIEEHYAYNNQLQCKNEEISKLKNYLKFSQRQIQILRHTMEQMLKADGKDLDEKKSIYDSPPMVHQQDLLLLQQEYHPSSDSSIIKSTTTPPSPLPCFEDDDDDDMSFITRLSDDSRQPYDFLRQTDDESDSSHLVKKSGEHSRRVSKPRRRINELEEMLDEVDSQLNKVKMRRPSATGN